MAQMKSLPYPLALSFLPSDGAVQPLPGCVTSWSHSQGLGDLTGAPGTRTLPISWVGGEAASDQQQVRSAVRHVVHGCSVDSGWELLESF